MYEGGVWRPFHFTLYMMMYHCVPTLNMYVWHTNTCTLLSRRVCNFSENTIFLNRLHVRNCVRIIEISDNRGTDNRGRTVLNNQDLPSFRMAGCWCGDWNVYYKYVFNRWLQAAELKDISDWVVAMSMDPSVRTFPRKHSKEQNS